jgi:hypothetical protein
VATFVSDIAKKAALAIGAVQLGENLTADESDIILSTFQQLLDSAGLERANIHTIRQDEYLLIGGQNEYTLGYDPTANSLGITAATNATAAVLTLDAPHGITVGQTCSVFIQNGAGNWQAVNGGQIATALTATTLSIPVNSTGFGALTGPGISLQVAGTWNFVRPVEITAVNLVLDTNVFREVRVIDAEQYADIRFLDVNAPSTRLYNDNNAPVSTVRLYPTPDQAYSVIVYSLQGLPAVLSLDQQVVFAQGYERYWVTQLAIEIAPLFGLDPSATLIRNADRAESAVKSRNRRSPRLLSDASLVKNSRFDWNYRSGMCDLR